MEFPHLKDTRFPDVNTVDVYAYQNNFDYRRWNVDTKIKLCNVLWNSDYKNVVTFENNSARDAWFNSLESYTIELDQAARIVPDNFIKLPIPYDIMARYNYLYVDMPIATSPDKPIDYENSSGIRRWYFFIDSISYLSPNSTQVNLELDYWMNYQNEVEINYMLLERGHAPVKYSDTDTYLSNPIANNKYLLAPDVNYDNAGITRSNEYVPFGNGSKCVCIASTCAPNNIVNLGMVTDNPNFNPFSGSFSYSDVDARYGHQLQVNGFTIGTGKDYSSAKTPANVGTSDNGLIPNNLTIYAIDASECYGNGTFFADVLSICPQFLNTVKACFVVARECLRYGNPYSIAGHTVHVCVGNAQNMLTKRLQKSDFAYPQKFERFAKLYTSPYAKLEITDNDGKTFEVNIEETSTMQVKCVTSVAFPYIDYRVYIDGIGGVGSSSYSWVDLRGQSENVNISNSDWFKYCFDWDIPTFALYMDGETAYQLSSFNRNTKMGINDALVSYHNSMRSANTAMENAIGSANTALANVNNSTDTARTNAYNSADTGKTNADNSADTAKMNTDDTANTAYTNLDNSCSTIRTNMDLTIATTVDNEEMGITSSNLMADTQQRLNGLTVDVNNTTMLATTVIENETTAATAGSNAFTTITGGAVGGIMGGAGLGAGLGAAIGSVVPGAGTAVGAGIGALGGIIIGAVGGLINAFGIYTNTPLTTQANTETTLATASANGQNAGNAATYSILMQQLDAANRRHIYGNNNTLADTQTNNNNANDRTNGNNTRNNTIACATRTRDTTKINAENTRATSRLNADNNYTTDRTNADNTRNVTVFNAQYTRQVSELNAKELLENAGNSAMAGILDSRNAQPIAVCDSSGNAAADYMRTRGIQIKVKTQSDSALQQTCDTFARYGYALNQAWDVSESGLDLMENFTYWKASDIWVDDANSSNNEVNRFFEKIFLDGVTVWNDPNKIGRVDIYAN